MSIMEDFRRWARGEEEEDDDFEEFIPRAADRTDRLIMLRYIKKMLFSKVR